MIQKGFDILLYILLEDIYLGKDKKLIKKKIDIKKQVIKKATSAKELYSGFPKELEYFVN